MSKTKAGGSSKNNRDSAGRRHGVKVYAGEKIRTGGIIVRQVGQNKTPGPGTSMGRDFTIFASQDGVVKYRQTKRRNHAERSVPRTEVQVV